MTARENRSETSHDPPSANVDVAKLRLELRHRPLTELEDEGVVRWDGDDDVVRKGPAFEEKRRELDSR